MYEPNVSLGAIISIVITLLSTTSLVVGFIWAIKSNVAVIGSRLNYQDLVIKEVKEEIRKLTQVMIDMASATQRQDGFERRLTLQGERLDRTEVALTNHLQRWHPGLEPDEK